MKPIAVTFYLTQPRRRTWPMTKSGWSADHFGIIKHGHDSRRWPTTTYVHGQDVKVNPAYLGRE